MLEGIFGQNACNNIVKEFTNSRKEQIIEAQVCMDIDTSHLVDKTEHVFPVTNYCQQCKRALASQISTKVLEESKD